MNFRVGGHRDIEVGHLLQQPDQIGRIHFWLAAAGREIAAQGNDMANPVVPVVLGNGAQLITGGVDTGQVRCRFQTGSVLNTFNNAVRTVTLAGVRTVGHGDKLRFQAAQAIDRAPQGLLHFTGARREKFKRDVNLAVYFGQALIQCFPLVGVKKAHTLPLSFACRCLLCCELLYV